VNYADRLEAAVRAKGNPCAVGLDPHTDLVPEEFAVARDPAAPRAERARAVGDFLVRVIELVAERVPAVKPQSAFFEALGADGALAWERVVRAARDAGLLVIGDVKRGDIGSTAAAYARAFLESDEAPCDAITVNPLLGRDSIEPFLEAAARTGGGIYVLVRTSNPGSADFQAAGARGEPSLSTRIADAVAEWGAGLVGECGFSALGAVVGATHPRELARLRERMPRAPLLLPGYGAQGAGPADVVPGFVEGRGALVSSSRAVLFAHRSRPQLAWPDATRAALDEMVGAIKGALGNPR